MLTIFPALRIFIAIPKLVGPKAAPAAIAPLTSTPNPKAIPIPIAIGKIDPIIAIMIPRAPISLRVVRSMSTPASMTSKISLFKVT